jgi:hypothetical protein
VEKAVAARISAAQTETIFNMTYSMLLMLLVNIINAQ